MKKRILLAMLAVGALTLSVSSEAKADHWNSCGPSYGGYYGGGYGTSFSYGPCIATATRGEQFRRCLSVVRFLLQPSWPERLDRFWLSRLWLQHRRIRWWSQLPPWSQPSSPSLKRGRLR